MVVDGIGKVLVEVEKRIVGKRGKMDERIEKLKIERREIEKIIEDGGKINESKELIEKEMIVKEDIIERKIMKGIDENRKNEREDIKMN